MNTWISVKDQSPPHGSDIFVWKDSESEDLTVGWYFGHYRKDKGVYSFGDRYAKPIKIFSHWMLEMEPPSDHNCESNQFKRFCSVYDPYDEESIKKTTEDILAKDNK